MTKFLTKFSSLDTFLEDEGKTVRELVLSGEGCLQKHADNRVSFSIPVEIYRGKHCLFIRAAEARRFMQKHPEVSFMTFKEAWEAKQKGN